jgi:hypothetical protein
MEEQYHTLTPQSAVLHFSGKSISNAVNLEHVLGDIQTDCGNLHADGSLCES